MPRSRCANGYRKNKSGNCERKMNGPKKSRCSNGTRRVYHGPNKGTCKAARVVYSKGPQRFRGSPQIWTPSPRITRRRLQNVEQVEPRRSSRLATKWTRNGHMMYNK
jgi:hypothetical protein